MGTSDRRLGRHLGQRRIAPQKLRTEHAQGRPRVERAGRIGIAAVVGGPRRHDIVGVPVERHRLHGGDHRDLLLPFGDPLPSTIEAGTLLRIGIEHHAADATVENRVLPIDRAREDVPQADDSGQVE